MFFKSIKIYIKFILVLINYKIQYNGLYSIPPEAQYAAKEDLLRNPHLMEGMKKDRMLQCPKELLEDAS